MPQKPKVHLKKDGDTLCGCKKPAQPLFTDNPEEVTCHYCRNVLFPPTNCSKCNALYSEEGRYRKRLLCLKCGKIAASKDWKSYDYSSKSKSCAELIRTGTIKDDKWLNERLIRVLKYKMDAEKAEESLTQGEYL